MLEHRPGGRGHTAFRVDRVMGTYRRFSAMILVSMVLMYGVMYLDVAQADHVYWSETRAYMAVLMGATMALVMLGFMRGMYRDRRANAVVIVVSVLAFAAALWLVRSQALVGDVAYMKAMIPHHSIAILTSDRAKLTDSRVQQLANGIAEAQRREIGEMEALIRDIEHSGKQKSP